MSKTTEELMKPRYEVIADWPGSEYPVGSIMTFDEESVWLRLNGELYTTKTWTAGLMSTYYVNRYLKPEIHPHLFKELEWWEERDEKDMPEYVREGNDVYKVYEWHVTIASKVSVVINDIYRSQFKWGPEYEYCRLYVDVLPATETEYLTYNQSKQ